MSEQEQDAVMHWLKRNDPPNWKRILYAVQVATAVSLVVWYTAYNPPFEAYATLGFVLVLSAWVTQYV